MPWGLLVLLPTPAGVWMTPFSAPTTLPTLAPSTPIRPATPLSCGGAGRGGLWEREGGVEREEVEPLLLWPPHDALSWREDHVSNFHIPSQLVGCVRRKAAVPPPELQRATTSRRLLWHLQQQTKCLRFSLSHEGYNISLNLISDLFIALLLQNKHNFLNIMYLLNNFFFFQFFLRIKHSWEATIVLQSFFLNLYLLHLCTNICT